MTVNNLKKADNNLDYSVDNIVATVTMEIKKPIDLLKIARKIADSEFNPERFPGIILRIKNPKTTFLVFSTGKMVVTGANSELHIKKAVKNIINKLNKIGIKLSDYTIKIENFVSSGNLHTPLDLNRAVLLIENSMYEPEIFPGLIYYMQTPKAVLLVFSNGKFVCTGAKSESIVKQAIKKLNTIINNMDIKYEKNENPIPEEFIFT